MNNREKACLWGMLLLIFVLQLVPAESIDTVSTIVMIILVGVMTVGFAWDEEDRSKNG